jgi:RimJ/RimL family protein N-acetyltransferase
MPFDFQPTLAGELVTLRPLKPVDFDPLYKVASDPLIWEQHPVRDRFKEDIFRRFFREALECDGAFLVTDTRSGTVIGSSRYHGYDEAASEIEIGWSFLARSHWGGAANGEMKRLMLDHAFRFVKNVVFTVGPQNFRSQKALEKIGAVRDGTRQNERGEVNLLFRINAPR